MSAPWPKSSQSLFFVRTTFYHTIYRVIISLGYNLIWNFTASDAMHVLNLLNKYYKIIIQKTYMFASEEHESDHFLTSLLTGNTIFNLLIQKVEVISSLFKFTLFQHSPWIFTSTFYSRGLVLRKSHSTSPFLSGSPFQKGCYCIMKLK